MWGPAEKLVQMFAHSQESPWDRFWRCHGWVLLRRALASLSVLELIGVFGLSQAERTFSLTLFFLLATVPVLLAVLIGVTLAGSFVVSWWGWRGNRRRAPSSTPRGDETLDPCASEAQAPGMEGSVDPHR